MGAPKGNKFAVGNEGGRPTKYKPEFAERAKDFCFLGANNEQLAQLFGVSVTSIEAWLREHKEFSRAVSDGREIADMRVAKSLYHRALGYSHPEEKIFNNGGEEMRVQTVKHYPPDVNAANLWLMNRRPDLWRDRKELTVNVKSGVALLPSEVSVDDWEQEATGLVIEHDKALDE